MNYCHSQKGASTMKKNIANNVLNMKVALRDVLVTLNKGVFGMVIIVDDNGIAQGLFTDGDVRRAVLQNASLSDPAEQYMNRKFIAGRSHSTRQENLQLMNEKIRHVPILDDTGRPVDLISWAEMWRLPVMEPSLGGNELKYVSDCVTSNWISSQGEYVDRFQKAFCDFLGVKYALTTSNGTTALHLAMTALGIGPGDEVIVPDLTFGASANTVVHCGATPVFVDVDKNTWTMDPEAIEEKITERTRAIMPVHLYGHPCNMDPIMEIAKRHNLFVVEDTAEALGAEYHGRKTGSIGNVGCFSFFANKVITTGEGGMITTNDPALFEKMNILRDHGMSKEKRYWHIYPGFNYRMTNLQAAIGLAQMERITDFLDYRQKVVKRYNEQLGKIDGITLPPSAEWAKNIYWMYSIVVDEQKAGLNRDELAAKLLERGIETRPFFYPMHIQPYYATGEQDSYPVTTWLSDHGLSLPTSNGIQLDDVDRVCDAIAQIVKDGHLIQNHLNS
jgi:perosamine synthetase